MLNGYHEAARIQFTSSFNFFMGSALTVLDAGFALKTHGSFVNGFTPFRAGVAGFDFSFRLSMPAILNEPVFFSWSAATPTTASTVCFTCDVFKPVVSATDLYASVAVIALALFIAFIGAIARTPKRGIEEPV